tara:strand:+ start:1142 stop:1327 length:186 start_codon:yes stop_codon:yes gene_type:complete
MTALDKLIIQHGIKLHTDAKLPKGVLYVISEDIILLRKSMNKTAKGYWTQKAVDRIIADRQ